MIPRLRYPPASCDLPVVADRRLGGLACLEEVLLAHRLIEADAVSYGQQRAGSGDDPVRRVGVGRCGEDGTVEYIQSGMVEHLPVGVDDISRRVVSHPASAEAHGLPGRIPAGRRAVARRWQVAGSASAPRSRPARSTAAAASRAWGAPIPPPPPRNDLDGCERGCGRRRARTPVEWRAGPRPAVAGEASSQC